jgi:hypothetical protein
MNWDEYVSNLMKFKTVLNPVGILKGLNTRAYETLYSGRILLQHTVGEYKRHEKMLRNNSGILFFRNFDDLKEKLDLLQNTVTDSELSYTTNSLNVRMKQIGAW